VPTPHGPQAHSLARQDDETVIERIVAASPGGWSGPSARYRLGPIARSGDWPVDVVSAGSFPTGDKVQELLDRGGPDAALILQRVMPRHDELERLRRAYKKLIFDFDDAIYSVPPDLRTPRFRKLPKQLLRTAVRGSPTTSARKRPLARTLARVDVCVVGNSILAEFAARHAKRVVEIPTTIEPVEAAPQARDVPPVLVWMGLPDNLQHLELVRSAFEQLQREAPFRLRIVSSRTWLGGPLPVEFVEWSPEAARDALMTASVGLAPLTDDRWTRGKCAFRAIQYGGHALPTVASPVGITHRVVLHGRTGFLARKPMDWVDSLRLLIWDQHLVNEMGAAALNHIRTSYSDELAGARWRSTIAAL
jgi:glycosyltransferase involved in cell wall biosynthesis